MEEILRCEKHPLNYGINYQPQLVNVGFLNHHQWYCYDLQVTCCLENCGSWVAWPAQALQNVHSIGMLSSLRKLEENKYLHCK